MDYILNGKPSIPMQCLNVCDHWLNAQISCWALFLVPCIYFVIRCSRLGPQMTPDIVKWTRLAPPNGARLSWLLPSTLRLMMETVPASETLWITNIHHTKGISNFNVQTVSLITQGRKQHYLKRMVMPLSDLRSWQRPLRLSVFMTSIFMWKLCLTGGNINIRTDITSWYCQHNACVKLEM